MKPLSCCVAALAVAVGMTASVNGSEIKVNLKKQLNLPRIIGGVQTLPGERPWMASLQLDGEHFCGGSLIDADWILTAAHCVEDLTAADREDFAVRIDLTDLETPNAENTHKVDKIVIHPAYAQGESTDIALLRLTAPASADVPRLSLATPAFMAGSARPGDLASVSGWGNTSIDGEAFPRRLRNVHVPLVSNTVCNAPIAYDGQVQTTELCAGYPQGGRDSCQGDSGGPLVVSNDGTFHQVGVVSWGEGCALPHKYGVYARVAAFSDWIRDTLETTGDQDTTEPGRGSLQSGTLVTGLRAEAGKMQRFTIRVPARARLLWVDIQNGQGDADLYVRHGAEPTVEEYDFAPFQNGNREQVLVRNPKAGIWHIMIDAYDRYEGLELMGFAR